MILYIQILILTLCTSVLTMVSLWLIVGPLGQFSLCHAGLFAVGAYAGAIFTMLLSRHGLLNSAVSQTLAMFFSLVIGGVFGGLAGLLAGVPAAKLKKEHITLSTLAFGEMIKSIITNLPFLGGQGFSLGAAGQSLIGIPMICGTGFTVSVTILCLVLLACLNASFFGRVCRAVREDEAAALSIGLRPARVKILAFCISGVIAGISGALFAHGIGTLSPAGFSYAKSTEYAMFCIPAGDSLLSAVFWGLICAFLPALLAPLGKHRMLLYSFGILVFILYKGRKGNPCET